MTHFNKFERVANIPTFLGGLEGSLQCRFHTQHATKTPKTPLYSCIEQMRLSATRIPWESTVSHYFNTSSKGQQASAKAITMLCECLTELRTAMIMDLFYIYIIKI